jgi:branched-subunit amino acid aminotransferase/4-amino-4-deoxychorismate lyase
VREFGLGTEPEQATRIVTAHLITSSRAGLGATVTVSDLPGYSYPYKSANYQLQSSLLRAAREFGFDEVLIAEGDELIEGATSNVFVIKGDELATPELGRCLPGITRQAVLDIAPASGFDPIERIVSPAELPNADGVFICNSLIELRPTTNYGKMSPRVDELREALLSHYAGDAI